MDSLETVREATALADWVALHERRLTTIYITHGHADHDLGLMASGDVAYNHCHMYVGATTADIRAEWIAALDQLAALNPAAVVTGHKDPTRGNPPSVLAESPGYLEYCGQLREAAPPDRELSTPW